MSDRENLPYLSAVIKELGRWYTVVPLGRWSSSYSFARVWPLIPIWDKKVSRVLQEKIRNMKGISFRRVYLLWQIHGK